LGEEYYSSKDDLLHSNYNSLQDLYNQKGRSTKFKYKLSSSILSSPTNYNDEFFYDFTKSSLTNLDYYSNNINVESIEDNYEFLKNLTFLIHPSYKNLSLTTLNYITPSSYVNVFNSFRADFSEANWLLDFKKSSSNYVNSTVYNNLTQSNTIKLRSTAKNSIVTYNAIQKVYKSRFDESRSNVNFKNFTNSSVNAPFITEPRSSYEGLLSKNKSSFFNTNLYNSFYKNNYSVLLEALNSNNLVIADLPFLVSMKSDASRYLWFD
jgi:hypothetical protein